MSDQKQNAYEKEQTANDYGGTYNYGSYKLPENTPLSPYQWAHGDIKLSGRTYGLSKTFNNNQALAGPINYAYFEDGLATQESQNGENTHTFTTLMYEGTRTARAQSLYITTTPDGEIDRVSIGNFNLAANTPIGALFNFGKYDFVSQGYSILEKDSNGELKVNSSIVAYIPHDTKSEYLQKHLQQEIGFDDQIDKEAPVPVKITMSETDQNAHPRIIVGELLKEYFQGYLRQDPGEAKQIISGLPNGMLEQFGLELTEHGIINHFIEDNELNKPASPEPEPAPTPAVLMTPTNP